MSEADPNVEDVPADSPSTESQPPHPERVDNRPPALWPLALVVALQFAALMIPGRIAPGTPIQFFGMMGGAAGGSLLILVWWFSRTRLPIGERVAGFLLLAAAVIGSVVFFVHPTMHGIPILIYVLPSLSLTLVAMLAAAQVTGWRLGRIGMLAGVVAMLAAWIGVRAEGVDGTLTAGFAPRWSLSAEQEFLAEAGSETLTATEPTLVVASPGDWTGFRGPARDGRLTGAKIADDWAASPPKELWRRKVGPGWGSFTIVGGLLYTQEQRGEQEVVTCYDAATGEPRWVNEVVARFEESMAGAGPRATPTFHDGRLYTTGGSGVVQCLDAGTGESVWRRSLVEDTSAELIESGNWWGFASSPLIVETATGKTLAIVYAGTPHPRDPNAAPADDSVIAYDASTGEPAWTGGVGVHGYASPHAAMLAGVPQVLISSNAGVEALDPATGERLWLYEWSSEEMPRVVQPTVLPGDRIVLATGYGLGAHLVSIQKDGVAWTTSTEWQTKKLKPYFNDLIHFEGHLYGFDGKFFTCLDAETGEVTWPRSVKRKAAFGHGQALLVEDSGLILIMTEQTGEVVLIEANPETLVERGRLTVLEGKTWNHPVIHNGRLYVRNGAEAACFELPKPDDAARRQRRPAQIRPPRVSRISASASSRPPSRM